MVAFGAAIAVAFLGAAAIGRAVGPLERGKSTSSSHGEEMGGDEIAAASPAGLAVAADGFRLVATRTTLQAAKPQRFAFRIVDEAGEPLRRYDVEHERRLHLIVVRRDLTGFQHLHPKLSADGTWAATLAPLEPGAYRAFADFSTGGHKTVLGADLLVPGATRVHARPPVREAAPAGPYQVVLDPGTFKAGATEQLAFRVTRGGKTAFDEVGRYLGARGHLVLLRPGDLAYVHAHADEDALQFETTFPSPGRYAAFLQFRAGGAVRTAAFSVEVTR